MHGWFRGARLAALALLGGAWVVVPVARAEAPHEVATFFEVQFDKVLLHEELRKQGVSLAQAPYAANG